MNDQNPFSGRRHLFYLNWLRTGAGMINREIAIAREIAARGGIVRILSHFKPQFDLPSIPVDVLVDTPFKHRWYDHWLTRRLIDRRASAILQSFRPHVIHTDLPADADRIQRIADPATLHIHTYHGTADGSAYEPAVARQLDAQRAHTHRMLAAADLPIVVSDYLLTEAQAAGIQNAHRIYNGVDLNHWSPATTPPTKPPTVLFIGRYTESKGVHLLLDAFIQAAPQIGNTRLHLHGFFERPDYETRLRATIKISGLQDRIRMDGPLAWSEMPPAIHRCTVFANGSVDESFCMPFLEAQACARVCLGFHSRGIPEVVLHETTGLLAPPGDVNTLAAHLIRLINDTPLRHQFEKAAHHHAQTFNYQNLTDQLATLIQTNNNSSKPPTKGAKRNQKRVAQKKANS